MLKSTDWFKEGPSINKWFRYRLQFCIFSGLAIGWWSKLRAAPPYPTQILSTPPPTSGWNQAVSHPSMLLHLVWKNKFSLFVLRDCNPFGRKGSEMWIVGGEVKKLTTNPSAGCRLACHSPHCHFIVWSPLAVSELQLSVATPLWLFHWATSLSSWIEVNCQRSAAVGKMVRLSIDRLDAAHRLVFPLRGVALAQLYKYHHQSSNVVSAERQASLEAALMN